MKTNDLVRRRDLARKIRDELPGCADTERGFAEQVGCTYDEFLDALFFSAPPTYAEVRNACRLARVSRKPEHVERAEELVAELKRYCGHLESSIRLPLDSTYCHAYRPLTCSGCREPIAKGAPIRWVRARVQFCIPCAGDA